VALPGHAIVSAGAGTGGLLTMSGTSMSTPVMTGLTAALMQINDKLDTGDLRIKLENSATRRTADTVEDWGLGRVDASVLLRP
jgi:subtilisin family serine protease